MEIREATYADLPAVEAVVAAAFDEELDGRTVLMMRALAATGAERASLVAVEGDEVVGHVGLSRGWVDARRELVEVLVLSPLSVSPDRQGGGIGTALVDAALRSAAERGAPAVFLEGAWSYYGARGFSPGASLGFERPSTRIPERAFQVALLPAHEPWMTGRLVYSEAFWATDTVGLRDPLLARVEERSARELP
ncbi:N-acetyltransferase [Nocardioides sp. CER19]|uniref:GNAT family N-acetyltransferase n=1 Tax=Nocardioides sp. CER19 TaxID=3038538 RepID=UPI002449756B|nr:N-acetyltransferase [Nocardioides sp. CER19]MDH2416227.1 N-acetyltransferase [Nocardioides sp. CER19]